MRAISLHQPFATGWVLGIKTIETRHWSTDHRGPLAVHAAKRWNRDAEEWWVRLRRQDSRWPVRPPLGAFVGIVELTDVISTDRLMGRTGEVGRISPTEEQWGNYGPERFGWVAVAHKAFAQPLPWPGRQSFFSVPDEVIRAHIRAHGLP